MSVAVGRYIVDNRDSSRLVGILEVITTLGLNHGSREELPLVSNLIQRSIISVGKKFP